MRKLILLFFASVSILPGISQSQSQEKGEHSMALEITSSVFEQGGMIPSKYTCDAENISPPLEWNGIPDDAESLALIVDDPDAPGKTWVHWVLFNLPAKTTSLEEDFPKDATLDNGAINGVTDFGSNGYGGPCPPGGTHRYYFKLYALDSELDLDSSAKKSDLLKAMEGHVLAEGQLMGKYKRQK